MRNDTIWDLKRNYSQKSAKSGYRTKIDTATEETFILYSIITEE